MKKRCRVAAGMYKGLIGTAETQEDRDKYLFYPDSGSPNFLELEEYEIDWHLPNFEPIHLDIPFYLGQKVWVNEQKSDCWTEQIPDGYDHLGRTYRLELKWKYWWEITSYHFHFGLLDRFPINEIYASEWECRSKANGAF